MAEPKIEKASSIAYAAWSGGYEVVVLDQFGQIMDQYSANPGKDLEQTNQFALQTAEEWAEELEVPIASICEDKDLIPEDEDDGLRTFSIIVEIDKEQLNAIKDQLGTEDETLVHYLRDLIDVGDIQMTLSVE